MTPIPIPPGPIDTLLRAYEGDFHLDPGEYQTAGAWAFDPADLIMLRGASALRGAGSRRTRLSLHNPDDWIGTTPSTYYQLLTGGGFRTPAWGTEISGLHIAAAAPKPVKALQVWGAGVRIRDVFIDGLAGRRDVLEGEAFGILINNAGANAVDGDNRVEDCRVLVQPGSYACAVYVGTELLRVVYPDGLKTHDRALLWSEVRDTAAISVTTPENRSHCAFGINSRTRLTRCAAHGFERAIFSDTGDGIDAEIRDFYASGCSIGVEFRSTHPTWERKRFLVENSTFVFGGGKGGYVAGLVLVDGGEAAPRMEPKIGDIVFRRCRFINQSGQPGHVGSSSGPSVAPAVFEHCEWIGAWDQSQAKAAKWQLLANRFRP